MTYSTIAGVPAYKLKMWKETHEGIEIAVFGDAECAEYLATNMDPWALELFERTPHGPIKADIFRVVYLYLNGGAYSDVDVVVHGDILQYCDPLRYNSVASAYKMEVNNTFVYAPAKHWITKAMLDRYFQMFSENRFHYDDYWAWSIGVVLRHVMDEEEANVPATRHHWCLLEGGLNLPFSELPTLEQIVLSSTGETVMNNRSSDYDGAKHKFRGENATSS
jgi:hypothetical protein